MALALRGRTTGMTIKTNQSMSGFIASEPQLSFTSKGDARFYARVGQEHAQKNEDGTFTPVEATYHDLVIFKDTAQSAYEKFSKGDQFVAEGRIRDYERQVEGETRRGQEFVAKRIGHNVVLTSYTVDRTRRGSATGAELAATEGVSAELGDPSRSPTPAASARADRREQLGDIAPTGASLATENVPTGIYL